MYKYIVKKEVRMKNIEIIASGKYLPKKEILSKDLEKNLNLKEG